MVEQSWIEWRSGEVGPSVIRGVQGWPLLWRVQPVCSSRLRTVRSARAFCDRSLNRFAISLPGIGRAVVGGGWSRLLEPRLVWSDG